MSLLFRDLGDPGQPIIPARPLGIVGNVTVSAETALRHSAVWAACRLRADLISTMPVGVMRQVGDLRIPMATPPVLLQPGGKDVRIMEWLYSSQMDLDRYGNAFGLISARDGTGLPARIDLVSASQVQVQMRSGVVTYLIQGKRRDAVDVWHERQYTVSGSPVGLSPIAYAALTIGQYISAQQFAANWFNGGQVPKGHLKNTKKTVTTAEGVTVKERFNRIFEQGGVFVSGADWEYSPIQAAANDMTFLQSMGASAVDVARFMGVPGDMIDAPNAGSSLTYQNVGQRNLQFLIMHLQPAIQRRAEALSFGLLPAPRFVEFDAAAALMRMDPMTEMNVMSGEIKTRYRTVDEAREAKNRPPLTEADYVAFERLFGKTLPQAPAAAADLAPDADVESANGADVGPTPVVPTS